MHQIVTSEWQRITKPRARKMYNEGHDVFIIPCKARLDGPWIQPVQMLRNDATTFDKIVNAFIYYNCQHRELGFYPAFYLRVSND